MSYPRLRRARAHNLITRTAGSLALTSSTWVNLSTEGGLADAALDIVLAAQSGDTIEYGVSGLWNNDAGVAAVLDVMTLVSSAGVHWFGSGEPTTSTGDGVLAWFAISSAYVPMGGSALLTLVSGDISSGTVTLRPRYKGSSASSKTMYASTTTPLQLWAKNLGPVAV